MYEFWRSWYLLQRLRRTHLRQSGAEQRVLFVGEGARYYVAKQPFLEQASKKRFWLFKRSREHQNKRMQKDNAILEKLTAQTPPRIDERRANDLGIATIENGVSANSLWVRTTGHGDHDAYPINALVHFVNEYKVLWLIIIAFVGWTWWPLLAPILLPAICQTWHVIEWCK